RGVIGRRRRARARRARAPRGEDRPRHHRHRGAGRRDAGEEGRAHVHRRGQRRVFGREEIRLALRPRGQSPRIGRGGARSPREGDRMSPAYPRELGRAFENDEVARNYRSRQPYPSEIFEILEGLLVAPRTVLDAGSGTGALTIGLARRAVRVDAVDPSAAMLREARRMPGADSERIRWIEGTAETARLDPPYG